MKRKTDIELLEEHDKNIRARARREAVEKANEIVTKVLLKEKVSHGIITKVNVKLAMFYIEGKE